MELWKLVSFPTVSKVGKGKAKKKPKKMPKAQKTMRKELLFDKNDSGDETEEAVNYDDLFGSDSSSDRG